MRRRERKNWRILNLKSRNYEVKKKRKRLRNSALIRYGYGSAYSTAILLATVAFLAFYFQQIMKNDDLTDNQKDRVCKLQQCCHFKERKKNMEAFTVENMD